MNETSLIGSIIDERYELLEFLGAGGIASVYKAKQKGFERLLAIKLLHPDFSNDEQFKKRFIREAQTLTKLTHSNIVAVYHVGVFQQNQLYIAMELVEGKSLAEHLEIHGNLDIFAALDISEAIASALAHAHESGIIHRDLKPSNVILIETEAKLVPKVIDFGLSRDEYQSQTLTQTGELIGTPDYMSPEQCKGQRIDKRSDIYSLTATLYTMLTGKLPFAADSPMSVLFKHINDPIPAIQTKQVKIFHPEINSLFQKGMAKNPDARFQSMEEFILQIQDLRKILQAPKAFAFKQYAPAVFGLFLFVILAVVVQQGVSHFVLEKKQSNVASISKKSTRFSDIVAHAYLSEGLTHTVDTILGHEIMKTPKVAIVQSARFREQQFYTEELYRRDLPLTGLKLSKRIIENASKSSPIHSASNEANPFIELNFIEGQTVKALINFGEKDEASKMMHAAMMDRARMSYENKNLLFGSMCKLGEFQNLKTWLLRTSLSEDLNIINRYCRSYGLDDLALTAMKRNLDLVDKSLPGTGYYEYLNENAAEYIQVGDKVNTRKFIELAIQEVQRFAPEQKANYSNLYYFAAHKAAMINDLDLCLKCFTLSEKSTQKSFSDSELVSSIETSPELSRKACMDFIYAVLNSHLSSQKKCQLLKLLASKSDEMSSLAGIWAYNVMNKAPKSVDYSLRLWAYSSLQRYLRDNLLPKLALKAEDLFLEDYKRNGPVSGSHDCSFDKQNYLRMSVDKCETLQKLRKHQAAVDLLKQIFEDPDWNKIDGLDFAYDLGMHNYVHKAIESNTSVDVSIDQVQTALKHNDLPEARSALAQAQKLQGAAPSLKEQINWKVMRACYLIESNQITEAGALLKSIASDMNNLPVQKINKRICADFALCLSVVGFKAELAQFMSQLKAAGLVNSPFIN